MSTPTGTPNDGSLSIITAKIINKIMDYEAGRLSDSQAVDLFQKLVDSGLAWQLEGHFARTARGLIDAGLVKDDERRVQNTRANIHFNYSSGGTAVNVYRHYDGYPEGPSGVLADLNRFFDDTEGQAGDTRFNDITFLAARFVVWEASRNCWRYAPDDHGRYVRVRKAPLDFDGVAVMIGDSPDAAYVYEVTETGADGGRPYVAWSTA